MRMSSGSRRRTRDAAPRRSCIPIANATCFARWFATSIRSFTTCTDWGFRILGSGFRVQGSGFRV
ncbi:hypothetical protein T484DRAFT_1965397 [Baffinella frigidus]|nr:hypothetical protein T484DRAFT_1965397 [Cryptophyta sp. CCMP2293]